MISRRKGEREREIVSHSNMSPLVSRCSSRVVAAKRFWGRGAQPRRAQIRHASAGKVGKVRDLVYLGAPGLQEPCREVAPRDVAAGDVARLARDLRATAAAHAGLGLAAPQIGSELRMFAFLADANTRVPPFEAGDYVVAVNPEVESVDEEAWEEDYEACLSVPGMLGRVARPTNIRVTYTTPTDDGSNQVASELSRLEARVFLHELDHLDGVLYLDRVEGTEGLMSEEFVKTLE